MNNPPVLNLTGLSHPDHMAMQDEWEKYRYIMEGGDDFIDKYLVKFSARETNNEFNARKAITPTAAFARGAIVDIKNSIFQRMSDISRNGGSTDYQAVIKGLEGGVDQRGSSINHFIGRRVLPELLFLGKVGVYVDMPAIKINPTLVDSRGKIPYFYTYAAEDIINWEFAYSDNTLEFTQLLLRDSYYELNAFGLPSGLTSRYRLLSKTPNGITVGFYGLDKFKIDSSKLKKEEGLKIYKDGDKIDINATGLNIEPDEEYTLDLSRIPFVLLELDQPLTRDIANHQIALMNLESSDISYALKSNYPFYTEQRSKIGTHLKSEENSSEGTEIEVGGNIGRAYAPGMDRPDFIFPSSEPLLASLEKQKILKDDIRVLINLALSNSKSKYASAESKELDERGLESGLSGLGLILEQAERELAVLFSLYEKSDNVATVSYPTKYSLKTDLQKLSEVEKLSDQRDKVPSRIYQKTISKKMATILVGTDVSAEVLQNILDEIDAAKYMTGSSEEISADIEHGLVSLETAGEARGYNPEEIEKAKKEHAERIARIAESQTVGAGARGINDLSADIADANNEKQISQDADLNETGQKAVRGDE